MEELKYEIVSTVGEISTEGKGWKKELNLIRWNDREPKYDLRSWSGDHSKMGKGITLTKEELSALGKLISKLNLG